MQAMKMVCKMKWWKDVAVNEIIEEKATSEESIENDNKILNIQNYLVG